MTFEARAAAAILSWYDRHRRDLPWRARLGEAADPYRVWLSEIMLQQTTVAAVRPYFARFLARWPTVSQLAEASGEEVMRAWAGLGYYSRARNLHACAKIIKSQFGGQFPAAPAALQMLPGIGPYTAAAIAAIAFGQRAAAVDGNVLRVAARLFAIKTPLPAAKPEITARVEALVPASRPGDFAQALMDLGATVCTPRQPECAICPLREFCLGFALGQANEFPFKAARLPRPLRRGAAFFICRQDGAILIRTRPDKGLLGGMAELPGSVWSQNFDEALAPSQAPLPASYRKLEDVIEHVFTHFALRLSVYVAEVRQDSGIPKGYRWVPAPGLDEEPFPAVMRKVIDAVRRNGGTAGLD